MDNSAPRESEIVDPVCEYVEEDSHQICRSLARSEEISESIEETVSRIHQVSSILDEQLPVKPFTASVECSPVSFELKKTVEASLTLYEPTKTSVEQLFPALTVSSSVPVELSNASFDSFPESFETSQVAVELPTTSTEALPAPAKSSPASHEPSSTRDEQSSVQGESSPTQNSKRRGLKRVHRSRSWRDEKKRALPSFTCGDASATALFAQNLLQFSLPVPAVADIKPPVPSPAPAPIFVEPPPSSDDNEDDPELRVVTDSKFLNGSSSNLLAKSAPSTPQGERLQTGTAFPATTQTAAAPGPAPKSPSHVFNRHDKQALKQLSVSAPVMTQAQAAARPQPASDPVVTPAGPPSPEQQPGSSKARQKKFHRHFKQVAAEERVLNYYSCALVGDILLQGHLYITKNYFAFYSNVFGYVTKLLIPTVSVLKISKEKTARIIPNAVGVATEEDKHVFCSLLSRDATYRLMVQVWKTAMSPGPQNTLPITKEMKDEVDSASGDIHPNEDDDDDTSSVSGSERSCPPTPLDSHTDVSHSESCPSKLPNGNVGIREKSIPFSRGNTILSMLPRPTLILIVSTGLLVLLFLSAAFLLYRIGRIHNQFAENPLLTGSDEVYQEILKWQTQLHSKSANEVQEFLNANLDQLAKVRQSLEALSHLIVTEENNKSKSPAMSEPASTHHHHQQQAAAPLPREKHS